MDKMAAKDYSMQPVNDWIDRDAKGISSVALQA